MSNMLGSTGSNHKTTIRPGVPRSNNTLRQVRYSYSGSGIQQVLTPVQRTEASMTERTILSEDILRGNPSFQVRSLLCTAQQSLVPSEPYRPANQGDAHNGWQVGGDFPPLVGQEHWDDGPVDRGRLPG
jgi:hypothetical protein